MNLEVIKNAVTSKVGRQLLVVQKNSPTILFGAGVVGVVATVVLSSRATLKIEDVLDAHKDMVEKIDTIENSDYTDRDRQEDKVKLFLKTSMEITKLYTPAVMVGVASIACLTGSHHIMSKRNAGLMAAYSALEKGFDRYRRRVIDEFGEDKDREYRHGYVEKEVVEETPEGPLVRRIKVVGDDQPSVYARFFDETSSEWNRQPEYNHIFLLAQQNYLNDLLRARGHVFLNEVYDRLGIERTGAGAVVGWVMDKGKGDNYIDFGIFDGSEAKRDFVNGRERSILLDFNVDGVIYDRI